MSSAPVSLSGRFVRAAEAENERLGTRLNKAKARARARKGELAAAEVTVSDLEAQIAALGALLGGAGTAARRGGSGNQAGNLRGRAIREVAVELLVQGEGASVPIHYRRWLGLLEARGYSVAGQRPEAVFLNQIVRHPLVGATARKGFYELDLAGAESLEARVAQLRTSLSVATSREADDPPGSPGRGSGGIALELRCAERALGEARRALAGGSAELHR